MPTGKGFAHTVLPAVLGTARHRGGCGAWAGHLGELGHAGALEAAASTDLQPQGDFSPGRCTMAVRTLAREQGSTAPGAQILPLPAGSWRHFSTNAGASEEARARLGFLPEGPFVEFASRGAMVTVVASSRVPPRLGRDPLHGSRSPISRLLPGSATLFLLGIGSTRLSFTRTSWQNVYEVTSSCCHYAEKSRQER